MKNKIFLISVVGTFFLLLIFILICLETQTHSIKSLSLLVEKSQNKVSELKLKITNMQMDIERMKSSDGNIISMIKKSNLNVADIQEEISKLNSDFYGHYHKGRKIKYKRSR